jgi:hypothetical protein
MTDILEEHVPCNFRVEVALVVHAGFLLGLLLNSKGEGDMLFQNVGCLSMDYTQRYMPENGTPHDHHCKNLKSYTIYSIIYLAHQFFRILCVVNSCQKNINGVITYVITSTVMYFVLLVH